MRTKSEHALRYLIAELACYLRDVSPRDCPECRKNNGHLPECPWKWIKDAAKEHGLLVSR